MDMLWIRHGETALNTARVFQPPDTPLSDRGLRQAEAAAQRLAQWPITAIVSSDMTRAHQTALALGQRLNLTVLTSPLLGERNFGDLRGKPHAEVGDIAGHEDYEPPNGESNPVFYARVAQAFDWALSQQPADGMLAVFTHGLVLRRMLRAHAHIAAPAEPPTHFDNTAITRLAVAAPHTVSLLACSAHLSEATGTSARGVSGL